MRTSNTLAVGSKAANVASHVMIGKILTFLMTGAALIAVTRLLGAHEYGIYTLAMAFGGIFGSIGYFGIGTALNKFVSEYKQANKKKEINEIVSNALFIVIFIGLFLGIVCIAFSSSISSYIFNTSFYSGIIKLVALYIITVILFGAFYDTLLGFSNGKGIAIVAGVEALFQATVSIVLAFFGFGAAAPIIGMAIGYTAGFVCGLALVLRDGHVQLVRPSGKFVKKLFWFSMPVALSNIGGNLASNIALIVVGYFVIPSVIGSIGITVRVGSLMSIIFDSISFALLPAFAAALVNKSIKKEVGQIYSYAVYLAIALVGPLLFYMSLLSSPFATLLFGNSYVQAPLFISIMSIGMLIGVAGTYASTLLLSAGRTRLVLKYNIIVNLIVLIVVTALVPFIGSLAYVISIFILSPILMDLFFIRKLGTLFKIDLRIGKVLRLVIVDIVVMSIAGPLYLIMNGPLLLVVAAALFLVLYPVVVVKAKGIEKHDLNTIALLSKDIPIFGKIILTLLKYAMMVA